MVRMVFEYESKTFLLLELTLRLLSKALAEPMGWMRNGRDQGPEVDNQYSQAPMHHVARSGFGKGTNELYDRCDVPNPYKMSFPH